jgi:aspartate racemase
VKTIGLIGGMSWESSLLYYRLINEAVRQRLGGLHSAQLLLYSVDFEPIERLQAAGEWSQAGRRLAEAAGRLQRGGADFLALCTNTMHRVAEDIEAGVTIPLLHIADPTALAINAQRLRRVGLLGTRFTMEQAFYRERLVRKHGLEVIVPGEADRQLVHRVIYDELCLGRVEERSRAAFRRIVSGLAQDGAQGVILGCTEITMLVRPADVAVPVFDTTALHASAAVDWALAGGRGES